MNVIEKRISDLNKALSDLSEVMKVINEDINNGALITNELQQSIINNYAEMGRKLIEEKERLDNIIIL